MELRFLFSKAAQGVFPLLSHFGHTPAQRRTQILSRFLTGELSSCSHSQGMPLLGQPAGGPPFKGRAAPPTPTPPPQKPWPGCHGHPPTPTPPALPGAHSGPHLCARAPPYTGARTPQPGRGPLCRRQPRVVPGAEPGPPRAPPAAPPRPAPRTRVAGCGVGCQVSRRVSIEAPR